jgi:sugar O-acyltransferase (sialic acid O-acetyltransferase NeuD family)
MEGIIILGSAGLAKEFFFYIKRSSPNIKNFIFVNDLNDGQKELVIDNKSYPVEKNWTFKEKYNFIVAVGNPKIKKYLVGKALKSGLQPSKTIVDPSAIVLIERDSLGYGGIISPGCVVTTNVKIGDYVTLNLNTTVGHDTIIGDFCTTNPGVHISGQCLIGNMNEFGTGCIVRDRLIVGSNKTFGAQSAVVKSIKNDYEETYIGVPSKILIKNE